LLSSHEIAQLSPPTTPSHVSVRQHPYRSPATLQNTLQLNRTPLASRDGAAVARPVSRGQISISFPALPSDVTPSGSASRPGSGGEWVQVITPVGKYVGSRRSNSAGSKTGSCIPTHAADHSKPHTPCSAPSNSDMSRGSSFLPIPVPAISPVPGRTDRRPRSRRARANQLHS